MITEEDIPELPLSPSENLQRVLSSNNELYLSSENSVGDVRN